MSTESPSSTLHLHTVTRALGELFSFQVSQMAAFYGELSRWNTFRTAQSEHVAQELHKLTKESFAYMSELGAEARKSHQAATKKGLAMWGVFA